jgi:hypothetical protein
VDDETMLVLVDEAIERMTWLTDSDGAMVALARRYATEIDRAQGLADAVAELTGAGMSNSELNRLRQLELRADVTKAVGWLGPHLANALKALGGTPAERKALGVEEAVRGRLAQLRAAR